MVGVDISEEGITNLLKFARSLDVKIKALVEDINKIKFDKNYDVIISTSTLYFLKKEESIKLIKKMKKHTNKERINLITVFTIKIGEY